MAKTPALTATARARKLGKSSVGVTIPENVVRALGLEAGDFVEISVAKVMPEGRSPYGP